jgi:RsmE family RNA methyltransferase
VSDLPLPQPAQPGASRPPPVWAIAPGEARAAAPLPAADSSWLRAPRAAPILAAARAAPAACGTARRRGATVLPMNLLLVDELELVGGRVALPPGDRRAAHLRAVLGARPGAQLRAGVVGGGVGAAEVIANDAAGLVLQLGPLAPARPPLPVELVLAIPRPKVLSRAVEIAAAFAVERIALTNAWRVDKSYLGSPRLALEALAHAARLGAEQGATTHVPPIAVHRRLMALLDARWPGAAGAPAARLLAHPGGAPLERALRGPAAAGPVALAIGPEGGWIAREVDTFVARGFVPVALGDAILRVEAAVAAALGQLVLLQRLAAAEAAPRPARAGAHDVTGANAITE